MLLEKETDLTEAGSASASDAFVKILRLSKEVTMKEQIIAISNELQQIYVKGIDTIHMANALKGLSDLINILSAENDGAAMEQRGEEDE